MKHYHTLPALPSPITAIAFTPNTNNILTIACSNGVVYQYDIESEDFTDWSKKHSNSLPKFFLEEADPIISISFNPSRPSTAVLATPSHLIRVDFNEVSITLHIYDILFTISLFRSLYRNHGILSLLNFLPQFLF